jgi:hypothetical protein
MFFRCQPGVAGSCSCSPVTAQSLFSVSPALTLHINGMKNATRFLAAATLLALAVELKINSTALVHPSMSRPTKPAYVLQRIASRAAHHQQVGFPHIPIFSDCHATGASGILQPISFEKEGWPADPLTMIDPSGGGAVPSALFGPGTLFVVHWSAE